MSTKETKTKAFAKKATTPTPEKVVKASVKNGQMDVVVTAKKFGIYVKGDVISMAESTAKACIKNGVVEAK